MLSRGRRQIVAGAALLASCTPARTPPPPLFVAGLPVSGALADAKRMGFDDCFAMDAAHLRCRQHGVMLGGAGPYEAAVDLVGSDGEGGFDQLTLWHPRDNYAVYALEEAFERAGWRFCYTGTDRYGDQMILTRAGFRFRVSMDLSYYSKRRLRLIPAWNRRERTCVPDQSVTPHDGAPRPPAI